jgi:hypothetical protein
VPNVIEEFLEPADLFSEFPSVIGLDERFRQRFSVELFDGGPSEAPSLVFADVLVFLGSPFDVIVVFFPQGRGTHEVGDPLGLGQVTADDLYGLTAVADRVVVRDVVDPHTLALLQFDEVSAKVVLGGPLLRNRESGHVDQRIVGVVDRPAVVVVTLQDALVQPMQLNVTLDDLHGSIKAKSTRADPHLDRSRMPDAR